MAVSVSGSFGTSNGKTKQLRSNAKRILLQSFVAEFHFTCDATAITRNGYACGKVTPLN